MNFLRFCVVGGAGFIAEAGALAVLTSNFSIGPFWSRWISFPIAVYLTFILNRQWSFAASARLPFLRSLLAYLGVQGVGLLCNLFVYSAAIILLPSPFNAPVIALTIAASAALLVNFAGSSRLVFKQRNHCGHDPVTVRSEHKSSGAVLLDGGRRVDRQAPEPVINASGKRRTLVNQQPKARQPG